MTDDRDIVNGFDVTQARDIPSYDGPTHIDSPWERMVGVARNFFPEPLPTPEVAAAGAAAQKPAPQPQTPPIAQAAPAQDERTGEEIQAGLWQPSTVAPAAPPVTPAAPPAAPAPSPPAPPTAPTPLVMSQEIAARRAALEQQTPELPPPEAAAPQAAAPAEPAESAVGRAMRFLPGLGVLSLFDPNQSFQRQISAEFNAAQYENSRSTALEDSIDQAISQVKGTSNIRLENPMRGGYFDQALQNVGGAGSFFFPGLYRMAWGLGVTQDAVRQEQFRIYQGHLNDIAAAHQGTSPEDQRIRDTVNAAVNMDEYANQFVRSVDAKRQSEDAKANGVFLPFLAKMIGGQAGEAYRSPMEMLALMAAPEIVGAPQAAGPIARTVEQGAKWAAFSMGLTTAHEPGREEVRAAMGQPTGFWPVLKDEANAALGGFVGGTIMHGIAEIGRLVQPADQQALVNDFINRANQTPPPGGWPKGAPQGRGQEWRAEMDEWMRRRDEGQVWDQAKGEWAPPGERPALPAPSKPGEPPIAPKPPPEPPRHPDAAAAQNIPRTTSVTPAAAESAELDVHAAPPVAPNHTPGDVLATYRDGVLHAEHPDAAAPPIMPVHTPDAPSSPIKADTLTAQDHAAHRPGEIDGKPISFTNFDPRTLLTDAATFQYKGAVTQTADANGVTNRLRDIQQWNPMASGNVVVWQARDGRQFIVDGHQRLGLWKTLNAAGALPPGEGLQGALLKASDGWTPADARAVAAKKNIQEGSGDVLDVAQVLRDRPDIWDKSLPTTDPKIKQAKGLAELSDEGWRTVLNGQVKPNFAALVGLGVPDKTKHVAVLNDMIRFKPADENGARFIINDANMGGFRFDQAHDLFGPTEASRTLAGERQAIFSEVMKSLRDNRRIFSMLDREQDRIEAAGNVLAATNVAHADRAARLASMLEKLAIVHGPVSAALNRAAQRLADGGTTAAEEARGFLADLERLIRDEGLHLDTVPSADIEPRGDIDTGTPAGRAQQTSEIEEAEARRTARAEAERRAAEEAAAQAAQPAPFETWFGDSKAVDATGQPLRVYHATTAAFDEFSKEHLGAASGHKTAQLGFFFSADPDVAAHFTSAVDESQWPVKIIQKAGANLRPSYLSIQRPYEIHAMDFLASLRGDRPALDRASLEAQGYDGIRIIGDKALAEAFGGDEYAADAWVAFEPGQIRTAIGVVPSPDAAAAHAAIAEVQGVLAAGGTPLDQAAAEVIKAAEPIVDVLFPPQPEIVTDSRGNQWRKIGVNDDGETLWEDQRGVRSIVENNIRRTEPVHIRPGTNEISVDRTAHPEYELAVAPPPTLPAPPPGADSVERFPPQVPQEGEPLEGEIMPPAIAPLRGETQAPGTPLRTWHAEDGSALERAAWDRAIETGEPVYVYPINRTEGGQSIEAQWVIEGEDEYGGRQIPQKGNPYKIVRPDGTVELYDAYNPEAPPPLGPQTIEGEAAQVPEDFERKPTPGEVVHLYEDILGNSEVLDRDWKEDVIANVQYVLHFPLSDEVKRETARDYWENHFGEEIKDSDLYPQTIEGEVSAPEAFLYAVRGAFARGEKPFRTIVEARKLAKDMGLEFPEGESANKAVDELVERAVVERAREIILAARLSEAPAAETFVKMVALYDNQPNLATRTSASVAEQAYSTPAPLAYVASRLAGIGAETHVLEPTAGNGMLLMEASPTRVVVNEINPARADALEAQGFRPSRADAAVDGAFDAEAGAMDVVIANPPFGMVREGGERRVFHVGDFSTTQIDHAIALNALKAMKADGRAVLIVGGVKAESQEERAAGYQAKAARRFYYQLLKDYNVTDIFTVSGDLYAKQGAGWPVDVIVIDGKGQSAREPLTKTPPPLLKTWNEVGEKLGGIKQAEPAPARPGVARPYRPPGGAPPEGERKPPAGGGVGGGSPVGGEPVGRPPAERPERPGVLDGTSNSSEPGPDGAEHPPVPPREGPAPGEGGELREPHPPTHPERRRPVAAEVTEGQTPYEPASQRGVKLDTLLPANLRDATNNSLDRLQREHGNIDDYVATSLNYPTDDRGIYFLGADGERKRPFAAEQIDAIGLGISNIEKGEGFIIGDQTGIGKGRVVAAMISYARTHGMVPVFVTEKPDLYGDMWRDLHDIGLDQQLGRPISMVMTNSGTRVPLNDEALEWIAERDEAREAGLRAPPMRGTFSASQSSAKANGNMLAIINGDLTPDVVFTTYDQMNSVRGAETERRSFLRRVAPRAFLIMDESHNAGGSGGEDVAWQAGDKAPPRSEVFREAVGLARSVMYSSATFAKSPKVMTLYSKTDMAKAVDNPTQLPALIEKGGVPLQQVVSSMLSEAGQYMRRERSFDGVSYDQESIPVNDRAYGEFADGLRSVFQFDRSFDQERSRIAQVLAAEQGGGRAHDTGVGQASASSTMFASVMHNVIGQMIMALKAEKAGERAVAALKAGEKPVIALSKTNASFISDFTDSGGLKIGDVADISFSDILKRYLERTRRVTITLGNDEKIHVTIPLSDMSPKAVAAYQAAEARLAGIDVGDLPVSPIDAIRNAIQKAGYSVREITGRDTMLDYSGGKPVLVKRPASEEGPTGKKMSIKAFNDGRLDAIVLNRSGATGVSLHASSKFADQRRRRMIIAEADPNIDTHMQMLGRIHRTGQVVQPAYTHLTADIPAEVRPTAVLMRKMASLNANTTGAAKSRFTSEAVDFLNKYGDRVVHAYLEENQWEALELGIWPIPEPADGFAAKVTGRLTLFPPMAQQAFLDDVISAYKAMIDELDASGTNDLEAKSVDLQARVLASQVLKPATGPSPFQGAVNLDKASVKSQGRAMKPGEVVESVAASLKADVPAGDFSRQMEQLETLGKKTQSKIIKDTEAAGRERLKIVLSALKEAETKQRAREKFDADLDHFKNLAISTYPGSLVHLTINGEELPAVVIGIRQKEGAKSPLARSSWEVTFALPSGLRSLGVPLSRLGPEEGNIAIRPEYDVSRKEFGNLFKAANKEGREDRFMISGNILAGYDASDGRGQIVNHTMEDGSTRPAILMNRGFNAKDFMAKRAVRFVDGDHVMKYLNAVPGGEVTSTDGVITIRRAGRNYEFETPAARGQGGKYYADRSVRDVWDNWERRGSKMRATMGELTASRLVDALINVDAVFETRTNQELATSLAPPITPAQTAPPAPPAQPAATKIPGAPAGWSNPLLDKAMDGNGNLVDRQQMYDSAEHDAAVAKFIRDCGGD